MASRLLRAFLDEFGIKYDVISHPKRETALQTAQVEGENPGHYAKVVIVKAGGNDKMFIIPANRKLDLFKAADACGDEKVRVEFETEIEGKFPDSEPGAVSPFGTFYGLPCFFDSHLAAYKTILFNAGTHTESYRMKTEDYIDLVAPQVGDYSVKQSKATSR